MRRQPELAGQAVTIRYSPFDLTRIEVFHRDISQGTRSRTSSGGIATPR